MDTTNIIYKDNHILICHKLPGVPVQTAKAGRQDMVSMLQNHLAQKGENSDIFLVHRLDQPVEGIMAFARTQKAAASLSRQLQEKRLNKRYLALTEGIFREKSGILEDYLLRDGKTNTSKTVPSRQKGAKLAKLSYEVQETIATPEALSAFWAQIPNCPIPATPAVPLSYVSIQLETGRHHQIRVQMAHAGHPLIGDKKYNPNCPAAYLPIGLCSVQISLFHPATEKWMEFSTMPQGSLFSLFTKSHFSARP